MVTQFGLDALGASTALNAYLSHKYDLRARRHALQMVRAWAAKGYQPIYLSGRQARTGGVGRAGAVLGVGDMGSSGMPGPPASSSTLTQIRGLEHSCWPPPSALPLPRLVATPPQGSYYNLTLKWLIKHRYPPGPIHLTRTHMPTLPVYFSVGMFKVK